MALSGMDGNMSLVKNEAAPAAVQRSSSLDSMQQNPGPVAGILPNDSEMLPASMPSTSSADNSLSPPCQPVQRSRSLPLLDSNQGISPELLANLTAADRGNILGNNSVGIEDSLSTSQPNNQGHFLQQQQQQQHEFLSPSHISGLSQQPLNLSQSADVKQFLTPFQQPMFPRPNMTRPVRNLIPHLGDWGGYQTGGRFQLRGIDTSMAGLPTLGPQGAGYNQAIFNPGITNIYSKVMDKALGFPVGEAFCFGRENVHVPFPSGQPVMNMNPLRQQGNFDGKVSKDGERQMNINLPKDGRGNLIQAHQHHSENNNDKTSPNMQALSDSVGGQLGDKAMLPLSVSVSVAFSEPSQDSPASLSRHSNSPAMPYRTSADQMLSMINYNEDQLLQEHGLMADNTVTGTLDDNFLSSSMGIGHPSTTRLTDSSNLAGMDSSPPSVNNEAFDLFDGGGDVEDANYMTDSLSPQPLAGNVDSDVHVTTSLASIGGQSGGDVLTSLPRNMGRGGFRVSAGKNPPEMKSPPNQGVNNDGGSTDMPPRRKGRPPSRNPGHRYSQPCQVCGKVFGSSSALAKHKLIHSSERRHKCVLCAKSFKRQDHLAGHMLTHRSKKPYECTVPDCGKSYCDIRSLRRHFESQHHGLPMENNMRFTGDEKDPELTAAEEAAAMQAQVQAQGHPSSALPNNSSYMSNALSGVPPMGNLTVNNFGQGMMQPASQQSPQQQQQQQQQQHQQQQPLLQQKHSGMNNSSNQSPDSPGSSSTPALQFLVRAAHYAQSSLPIAATSPNNQSDVAPLVLNPQIPVPQDIPALNRLADLINPAASSQLSPSTCTWNMTSQYEPLSNATCKIMECIPAPRLVTTMAGLTTNSLNNPSSRRILGSTPGSMDVRQPSPRGPSPGKSSDSKDKNQQPVECSVCKRTFKSMPALNGHMRLHGGYNNARGESSDNIKGEPKYQPRQQQVPTPPRTSQSRSTPDMRGNHQVANTAPSVLSLPNHHLPPSLSQTSLGQMPMQPAPLHVSVPVPSFTVPMPGLSQPPPQMTHLPNLNSLRTEQLELQAQVKQELNVLSVPKQSNPFFSEASFMHHQQQQLPTSYPQFMPVPLPPLKDMPYAVPVNYHPASLQTVPKVPKLEPFSPFEQQIGLSFSLPETELSPPRLEAIKPPENQNVFRNPPPPTQPSPTKKRPRPSPLHIPSCVSTGTPGGIIPGTYQSQMRSPRELGSFYSIHHAYRSAGTGTTPPPYTPPPMLSPIRSGPGLYFNVPTMTPKTPSMMSMHRRNSSAAADEPLSDFIFSSEPHINIGSEFQAKIPDLLESREDLLTTDHRLGWVAWDSSNNDKYTISELTNFLQLATSAALPGGARNLEYAHHCLQRADGDIELALKMLMKPDPQVENQTFSDYNYNFTSTWSQGERKTFRDHFKSKGKDFHEIQKGLPTKSVKEIVEYYYRWKKLFPYNRDMQKFCHHSRINPTEDMRRNECDLYPEETFIDYVPLKEYRPDKYYRGRGQTRNNNHVKTSSNQEAEKPANHGSFTCNYPDCGASFKSRQALNGHIRVHGGSYKSQAVTKEPPPVQRSVSPLSVSTVSTSGTSRRMSTDSSSGESVEPEPVTFPCKLCGKVFYKVKSRSAHMKSHRKPELVKKVPSLSPLENSPPEFGTEPINHYVNNSEDEDMDEDDDFPNEAGCPDDGSSTSGRSGSRSDSSGSSSYGDSDSETGNSDTGEPSVMYP